MGYGFAMLSLPLTRPILVPASLACPAPWRAQLRTGRLHVISFRFDRPSRSRLHVTRAAGDTVHLLSPAWLGSFNSSPVTGAAVVVPVYPRSWGTDSGKPVGGTSRARGAGPGRERPYPWGAFSCGAPSSARAWGDVGRRSPVKSATSGHVRVCPRARSCQKGLRRSVSGWHGRARLSCSETCADKRAAQRRPAGPSFQGTSVRHVPAATGDQNAQHRAQQLLAGCPRLFPAEP